MTVFISRRSRVSSARSSVVSGPFGSFRSSIAARSTQVRTADGVSSYSLATSSGLLPLVRTTRTISALYSRVKVRLFFRSMDDLHHIGGVHETRASSVTALGGKRYYPVFVDEMMEVFDVVAVSAGVRGTQIVLAPSDYLRATHATVGAIASFR